MHVFAVIANSAALSLVTDDTLTVPAPTFDKVSVSGALVEPTGWLPKFIVPEPCSSPGEPPPPPPPVTHGAMPTLQVCRNSAMSPRSPMTLSGSRSSRQ